MSYIPPSIPNNINSPNPGLKDLLDAVRDDVMKTLNCHAIATVQSFTQNSNGLFTITATMNYSKTFWRQDIKGVYSPVLVDYPTLVDMPAIILGGGQTYMSFPISKGDQCLVLFNDRDLNNWFAGAHSGPVATARMHSFSDGIALVGFQTISAYDASHALLANGNAEVGVTSNGDGHVRIANNSITLGSLLTTLVNDLITAFGPLGPTPNPAAVIALTSVLSSISGLLE